MRGKPLVIAGLLIALAAGCGPQQSGIGDATISQSQPRVGGVFNVPTDADAWDWDMTYGAKSTSRYGPNLAYNRLIAYATGPGVKYDERKLKGDLAERWEVSSDAKTYTFHLRNGVKWANLPPVNGRDFTAADVKWTYEYASRTGQLKEKKLPEAQHGWYFEGLAGVQAPDPYTVVVRFQEPFVPFISYAASNFNPIMPHEIYDQDGHLKDRIVGTGAFQLDEASSQKRTRDVFKKNPSYFEAGKPYLDEVRVLVLPEAATAIAAFQTKQLDWLYYHQVATPNDVENVLRGAPQAVVDEQMVPASWHLYFNTRIPPYDNRNVRKAFDLALDRDEISRTIAGKVATRAPSGAFYGLFNEEETKQLVRHDPAEARRLLASAGFLNGVELQWEFSTAQGNEHKGTRELMQAQVKKVGINITFKPLDQAAYSTNRKQEQFTINMQTDSCGASQDDQDISLFGCYHSKAKQNYHGTKDPELDRLLLLQRQEADPGKRREIHREVVRRVVDQAYGLDLYYPPRWEVWHPHVKNYASHASIRVNLVNTWVDK